LVEPAFELANRNEQPATTSYDTEFGPDMLVEEVDRERTSSNRTAVRSVARPARRAHDQLDRQRLDA
jgi:hypothetical protein